MRLRLVFILLLASSLHAAEVLDNDAVVRMVSAGLSMDVIATKIAQSPAAFDTSVDALIALKSSGVPDPIIKAMLMKTPAPAPAPVVAAAASVAPETATPTPPATQSSDAHCVQVQYYTLDNNGWAWKPSFVCATATGIDIDEQHIAYANVAVHCFVASPLPRAEQEWWLSDGKETHKFRARGNELQSLSDYLARAHSGIAHGSCSDRALRKMLPGER